MNFYFEILNLKLCLRFLHKLAHSDCHRNAFNREIGLATKDFWHRESILMPLFITCQETGVWGTMVLIMGECVFCGISEGKLPAEFVFKDEEIVVFRSKSPRAPVHLLLIPRIHIEDLESLSDKLVLSIKKRIVELVKELDLDRKGYRVITNGGTAKAVAHLHFHLLGNVTVSREV